jgi:hypothetical protein
MSTSDDVLHCRLIGGPLDGLPMEEWLGVRTIIMNADYQLPSPQRGNAWAIYKRCDPDVFTPDGLAEFHYFATRETQTE